MLDGAMDLTPGLGTITMEVTGADAVIESLSSKVYEDEESLPVSITATSEETSNAAENVYDKDEKTLTYALKQSGFKKYTKSTRSM